MTSSSTDLRGPRCDRAAAHINMLYNAYSDLLVDDEEDILARAVEIILDLPDR